ncbi:hypothetical protein O59_000480 [Cellvibrio sp. BR]|nr:hypothetical protein O59_000480 [Cellvibrio sp. BR]
MLLSNKPYVDCRCNPIQIFFVAALILKRNFLLFFNEIECGFFYQKI